jgi:signal transduction histidine kinase/ligand-binding sensor domain-containing protein
MPNERHDAHPLPHRLGRLALGALLAFSLPAAHALYPAVRLVDYHHTIWTAKDGAPGAVTMMAQTRDGWLWLGTPAGLYRFDGLKFSKFVPPDGTRMLGSGISNLYVAPDGALLVGYITGGVSVIRGERLAHVATPEQVSMTMRARVDADGTMWIGTVRGLMRGRAGKWDRIGAAHGFPGTVVDEIFLDQDGRLLVSSQGNDVYRLDRQRDRFAPIGAPGGASTIATAPDGTLWGHNGKLWRILPVPPAPAAPSGPTLRMPGDAGGGMFDRDGNHWAVRCPAGLCRTVPAALRGLDRFEPDQLAGERLDQAWQMSSLAPSVLFEDMEGSVWIGTRLGLERFRHNRLSAMPLPAGEKYFQVVRDDRGNALAVSKESGSTFAADGAPLGKRALFTALASGLDGSLLLADDTQVQRIKDGRTYALGRPTGSDGKPVLGRVTRLEGNADETWAAIAGGGLFRFRDGQWAPAGALGLPSRVTAMNVMPDGASWFAQRDGSVLRYAAGRVDTMLAAADKPIGAILQIDATDGVVLAGEESVAVLEDGKLRVLRGDVPEALAGVTGMLRTANGDRWFNGRKGAVRVDAKEWKETLATPGRPLHLTVYDNLDGYTGTALGYTTYSTMAQTADGRLWFVSEVGIMSLDPANAHANPVPPAPVVEPIRVADVRSAAGGIPILPPGTTSLRLDYTALSLAKPERIRFRYRLEGVDEGWQEAGTRRAAFYTRLGPGTYRFRVATLNEDGVPSASDAHTDFVIAPTMVQTGWFHLLLALAGACLLALAYRWRTRRLAQSLNERFQERLDERERIARALHDTLLQNMQALILRLHAAVQPLERGGAARTRIEAILDQADTVMGDARAELKGLRQSGKQGSEHGGADIGQALAAFGQSLQDQFGPRFRLVVGGTARELQAVAWQELYYIGREALFNAYQHACAGTIEAEITYGANELGLVVRDDGAGIAPAVQRHGGREGHWGLAGMKERARALDGTLEWWSRAGRGTEVIARFPAPRVYVRPARQGLRQRLLALLGRRA